LGGVVIPNVRNVDRALDGSISSAGEGHHAVSKHENESVPGEVSTEFQGTGYREDAIATVGSVQVQVAIDIVHYGIGSCTEVDASGVVAKRVGPGRGLEGIEP